MKIHDWYLWHLQATELQIIDSKLEKFIRRLYKNPTFQNVVEYKLKAFKYLTDMIE